MSPLVAALSVDEVVQLLRSAQQLVAEDVTWSMEQGRRQISQHWQGLAAAVAQDALGTYLVAVDVFSQVLVDTVRVLGTLASATAQATEWHAAAGRLAQESGVQIDSSGPFVDRDAADPVLAAATMSGVQQLLDAGDALLDSTDQWCASELAGLAHSAPPVLGAPYAIRGPEPGSLPGSLIEQPQGFAPLISELPVLQQFSLDRPPPLDFEPGVYAEAALAPGSVAADLAAPLFAREVAARLDLTSRLAAVPAGSAEAASVRALLSGVGEPRRFLLYDPAHGRIAEVVGDIATARDVVIVVPGVGSSLRSWSRVSDDIHALYDAMQAQPSGASGAVIGWLGSDEPSNVALAALQSYAEDGAPRLAAFVAGLGLGTGVRLTIVGHSYGAVVGGLAVRSGLHSDALVGVGAPGFGPRVHGIGDLADTPTFVLTDPRDPINEVQLAQRMLTYAAGFGLPILGPMLVDRVSGAIGIGHLGMAPICLAGAQRLSTGNDRSARPLIATDVDVHTDYFVAGGLVDRQIAAVALGVPAVPYEGPNCR